MWRKKYEQNAPQYASAKIDGQKLPLSHQFNKICSKEVESYHVDYEVPEAAMDKHAGYYCPWPIYKGCWAYPEKENEVSIYQGSYSY